MSLALAMSTLHVCVELVHEFSAHPRSALHRRETHFQFCAEVIMRLTHTESGAWLKLSYEVLPMRETCDRSGACATVMPPRILLAGE
ncbi:hypothetical protein CVV68_06070 [Arthrobacter livingstonensis]|uniref:Uncharacterized protein n=1 Tax=Arthrobacter livingstonensis TaxID=670078 RepID=A0A2V5LXA3_9MICC|nr:hypothetical protein CVV68_06070 [Arthrobacter livingstonensis]